MGGEKGGGRENNVGEGKAQRERERDEREEGKEMGRGRDETRESDRQSNIACCRSLDWLTIPSGSSPT